ncbi:MAG: ATP-binding protein, partial [Candidatus Eremiobacteraeota bacterium]|nr:ATP-binding protein [Candidatus Eremiobacteraeota bacterium]
MDWLDFAIPSDVGQIERVVDAVVARCQAHHYPRRACALNVPVALTEALANAIVSGNREDAAKRVHVRASVNERELVLEVRDEGPGFDLGAETWGPDALDVHDREDGRGLFLMRRLMDHVEQFIAPGSGNVIRMT